MYINRCFFIAVQCILFVNLVHSYQIEIPSYQLLKSQKILTQQFPFESTESIKQITKTQTTQKLETFNNRQKPQINFQMFLYPYRIYSYFDQANKKQYLMKKIRFAQFSEQLNQKQQINQKQNKVKSILDSQINIKDCLFGKHSQCSKSQKQKTDQQAKECLTKSQLYSLVPDLMTIVQEQHEQIQLQKITEEHMLIKNHADNNFNQQLGYFLNLDLYKLNLHSFIYEARLTLLKYLFEQISSSQKDNQTQLKSEQMAKILHSPVQTTEEREQKQITEEREQKFYQIKINQFFKQETQIWNLLYQKNSAIFRNLFNFETSFSIQKQTKFDYLATRDLFYLAQIDQLHCPLSTHNKLFSTFSTFSTNQQNSKQSPQEQSVCTYLKLYKIPFVQFQVSEPVEYVVDEEIFNNVQRISLGLRKNQYSNTSKKNHDLLINIMTKEMNIEISYGRTWKQIRGDYRPKQHKENKNKQEIDNRIFFVQNGKVDIQDNKIILYTETQKNLQSFTKKCQLKIEPFVISSAKINNQIFVVCAEGSICKIINKQCQILQQVQLENALGVQWNYKINYVEDKILSFVVVSKRSDNLYRIIGMPADQTKIQISLLRTGQFRGSLNFTQVQPGLYQGQQHLFNSIVKYKQNSSVSEIFPSFSQNILPYKFNSLEIFPDLTYQSFSRFKERFLDETLKNEIQDNFLKFYTPNFTSVNDISSMKLLEMRNHSDFEEFFNDCFYDDEKNAIYFEDQWNGCKVILKTNALMLAEPFQQRKKQENFVVKEEKIENKTKQAQNYKDTQPIASKDETVQDNSRREVYQIFTKEKLDPQMNKMIVCSAHKSSPAYSKCKVSEYEVTQSFHECKRRAKFFFEGSRYFQLYFFNVKFLTESTNQSFLEMLESLARKSFAKDYIDLEQGLGKESELKDVKIVYSQFPLRQRPHFDIVFVDYEKQQIEKISRILLLALCILFPTLMICCCVVCFKSYFQSVLIYYGVLRTQASFSYPLGKMTLKIKMKELQQNGYATIHKNKRTHTKDDETSSNFQIKYSAQCCFCLEQLRLNQQVVQLYCKHEFHSRCFREWVRNQPNTRCPLCKRTFTKSALLQYKSRNGTITPTSVTSHLSGQNQNHLSDQNYQLEELSNELQMIQFQS